MTDDQSIRLLEELHKSTPSKEVELFELDMRSIDGETVIYFHNGTTGVSTALSFMGQVYDPLPIAVRGMDLKGTDEPPRPSMTVANLRGFMSSMMQEFQDLIGAKLVRRRTMACFLDGEPEAGPIQFAPDIFFIERKVSEDDTFVEFELSAPTDLDGTRYPIRTVTSTYCSASYRGAGCGYAGLFVVASRQGQLYAGQDKFYGLWNSNTTYPAGASAYMFDGTYHVLFKNVSGGNLTNSNPVNNASWEQVQTHKGKFDPTYIDYQKGDVVYLERSGVRALFLVKLTTGMALPRPPHPTFFDADVCGKYLRDCRARFDPLNRGLSLRFNGFPGTMNLTVTQQ